MKKKLRGIVKNAKRLAVLGLAGCLLYGASGQASATVLKDVFDEKYYAETNADVKKALGDDKEALWQHYMTYGLAEGRSMNYFFDVAKYRAMYSDLDKAFGDDWDAYLNHYLTYGAKEKRNPGTTFDALAYAARYPDLKALFGDDIVALWNHYKSVGVQEKRNAKSDAVVAVEKKAEEKAQVLTNYNETAKKALWTSDFAGNKLPNGDRLFNEWDKDGRLVRSTYYYGSRGITADGVEYSAGTVRYCTVYEYDTSARLVKMTYYGLKKVLLRWNVYDYDKDGNYTITTYNPATTTRGNNTAHESRQENVRSLASYNNLNELQYTINSYNYKWITKDVIGVEYRTWVETDILLSNVLNYTDGTYDVRTYNEDGTTWVVEYRYVEQLVGTTKARATTATEWVLKKTKEIFFASNGYKSSDTVYTYKPDGRYTVVTTTYTNGLNPVASAPVYYNADGSKTTEAEYNKPITVSPGDANTDTVSPGQVSQG